MALVHPIGSPHVSPQHVQYNICALRSCIDATQRDANLTSPSPVSRGGAIIQGEDCPTYLYSGLPHMEWFSYLIIVSPLVDTSPHDRMPKQYRKPEGRKRWRDARRKPSQTRLEASTLSTDLPIASMRVFKALRATCRCLSLPSRPCLPSMGACDAAG